MISNVVQRGYWYWIYNGKGKKVGQVTAGDGLVGFTSETVSVKHGTKFGYLMKMVVRRGQFQQNNMYAWVGWRYC